MIPKALSTAQPAATTRVDFLHAVSDSRFPIPDSRRERERTRLHFRQHAVDELADRYRRRLLLLPGPAHVDRHHVRFRLTLSDDREIRDLHAHALGDLVLERLRPRIGVRP